MKYSAAATDVKNAGESTCSSVVVLNGCIMLPEASTNRAMRRPGDETCSRINCVYGSANAKMKNGDANGEQHEWQMTGARQRGAAERLQQRRKRHALSPHRVTPEQS